MTAARRDDGAIQMIEQIDEKHTEAHRRLRHEFDLLSHDVDLLKDQVNKGFESAREGRQTNANRIEKLETSPVDVTKLVLSSKVVVTLVIIALGIAASVWKLQSSISDLAGKMDTTYKLQELQNNQMKDSIDEMKREQKLRQYEVQELKDAIRDGFAGKTVKVK